jgi:hypothetical protein
MSLDKTDAVPETHASLIVWPMTSELFDAPEFGGELRAIAGLREPTHLDRGADGLVREEPGSRPYRAFG